MTSALLPAARAKAADLATEVAKLRDAERREVSNCATSKTPVGKDYWQARHDAEQKLRAAEALVKGLIDVD